MKTVIKEKLNHFGQRLTQDNLIVFDYKVLLLVIFAFIAVTVLVTFKINGSSVGFWNYVLKDKPKEGILLGSPKGIRSDEWLVNTPFILNQVQNNFPLENDNIGGNKDTLLTNLPIRHYTMIFRPQFWGFFLLDTERAFSFFWNFKIFICFFGIFFLLMLLTKNNFFLSLFGSVWVFLSAFTQWWFSIPLPELVGTFSFICLAFIYMIMARKKTIFSLAAVVFVFSSVNFALIFYPPFQIPLFYLGIAIIAGYFLGNKKDLAGSCKENLKLKITVILLSVFTVLGVLAHYFVSALPTIQATLNTGYPGRRVSAGGDLSLVQYFSGYYSVYFNQLTFPAKFANICEASSFILFFPVILLLSGLDFIKQKRINPLLLALFVYIIVLSIFAVVGLPLTITKATLLSMTLGVRAVLGIGLASILATVIYLSGKKEEKSFWPAIILFAVVGAASVIFGLIFAGEAPEIITLKRILVIGLTMATLSVLAYYKQKVVFAVLIFALLAPGLIVNPVNAGLGSIYNHKLAGAIKENNDKKDLWIVFGSSALPAYLKANGANVVGGVSYTPNKEVLGKLDPAGLNEDTTNRYAHIGFQEGENEEPTLKLIQGDSYEISVDPCSERVRSLGVTKLLFAEPPRNGSCLNKIDSVKGGYIYSYK